MSDGKASILLVDDSPDKLLAIEAVLEGLGENLVRAGSGREALWHVLHQEFAVILLDVNMPGMDGFETATMIRQRKNSEHVPIIFITAFNDELLVSRGYSLGAVDYILAPVVPEVLRTKVAVFVDLFRKSEQVKRQAESLRHRAAQLHKLTAASLSINSALSTDKMLQVVTETARDVIGAHQATAIMVPEQNWAHAVQATSYSDKYAEWRHANGKPRPTPVYSLAARLNEPVRFTQAQLDARLTEAAAQLLLQAAPTDPPSMPNIPLPETRIPPLRGVLAAPLSGRDGRSLGSIYLTDRYDAEFTDDDLAILVQLAQMASIAIENNLYAEAREANRLKDEFLATLSHELRTPLNAILGWTQLLRSGNVDPEESSYGLDVIERNVRVQTKLIEDLLDVSRITSGKLQLQLRPTSLGSVIRAAIDSVRPAADSKGIAVQFEPAEGESDTISGDADRLQQVVWNLLSNAIKFTPPGGVVMVRTQRDESHVAIRITDSGKGIAREFLPYIFDRFRQADSSSTRAHGGLGIGLTIVRHLVELHGGTVDAQSPGEGRGATFIVRIPVASAKSATDPVADAPALAASRNKSRVTTSTAPRETESVSLEGLRVLV